MKPKQPQQPAPDPRIALRQAQNQEKYIEVIARVADEIWLRSGGNRKYCTRLK